MLMLSGDSTEGERVIPQSVGSEASAASDAALSSTTPLPRGATAAAAHGVERTTATATGGAGAVTRAPLKESAFPATPTQGAR